MKQILFFISLITLISCDVKSSADYNSEAEKLEKEGKYVEAILLLDKAIEKDSNNIYAFINRAVDKSILEDYQGAIIDYTKVLQIDSNNILALLNRGKNKKRLENYIGAIEDFEKAINVKGGESFYVDKVKNSFVETGYEFDVSMEEIRYERGIARYQIGSLNLAFKDFNFCIEKNYEASSSHYWRGIIYLTNGMNEEGCSDLTKAQIMGEPHAQHLMNEYCK